MKRRQFLKTGSASGLALFITPGGLIQLFSPDEESNLLKGFQNPPHSAKPEAFYLFMNGNISAEGISKDLEALSKAGIGGVLNYNAGVAIPKGNVTYFSEEWYRLLKHTLNEAERLGMSYAMHNCPGWSSSGGPWVKPEMSMQKIVWTETQLSGDKKIKLKLAKPLSRLGYYEDSLVIAYPSLPGEEENWTENVNGSTNHEGPVPLNNFSSGEGISIEKANGKGYLLLEFKEPVEIDSLLINAVSTRPGSETIHAVGPFSVDSSEDGINFKTLASLGNISSTNPGNLQIEPVMVRLLRLNAPDQVRIEDLNFYSKRRRLADWMVKTNAAMRPAGTRMYERAPWAGAENKPPAPPVPTHRVSEEFVIRSEKVVDLTDKMNAQGELQWEVPPGSWTVLRFGHTSSGVTNRAAPDQGQGLECDKFSKEAFDVHFDGMMSRILPMLKSLGAKGKAGLEIDSYEVGMQNWTKQFPQAFEKSRRYSLIKFMAAFTGRVVDSESVTENFLWDARRVMADMMAENYYGRCAERCHENDLLFYGEPYKLGPMEGMQVGSKMDNVMGEFWARGQRNGRTLKLASSIQHLNGKKIIAAESFTGHGLYSKWQQYPFSLKAQGDYMFTQGLTRMIFHTSAHQPHPTAKPGMTMGPFGTHLDRNVTWFEQSGPWMLYISRCQYLLQQGLFVADLLYYTGEDAPGEEIGLKEGPIPAPEYGSHYDYINTEILLTKIKIKDGRLTLPDGMSYRLLVLPPQTTMSITVLAKLKELAAQGAAIMGNPPTQLSGLTYAPEGQATLEKWTNELWKSTGKVFRTREIPAMLRQLNISPDFEYRSSSADAAINYIHRRLDGTDLYFITNRKRRLESLVCSFRISGKIPEFWDAATGETSHVSVYQEAVGRIQIPIHLQPAGSVFVIFKTGQARNHTTAIKRDGLLVVDSRMPALLQPGKYREQHSNFSQSVWIKPETDIALRGMNVFRREDIASFAFSPAQGELIYGKGHAICGLTAGRNGLVVYERMDELVNAVLEIRQPLQGWTHIGLVYKEKTPHLFINGKLAGTGSASVNIVHPSVDEELQDAYTLYFEGDIDQALLHQKPLSPDEVAREFNRGRQYPLHLPDIELATKGLLFWKNGEYEFIDNTRLTTTRKISNLREPQELKGNWKLSFPEGCGAPASVELDHLHSLHLHTDDGVKHFSGTMTYEATFDFSNPDKRLHYVMDLGQVEVLAEVILNGKNLGIIWQKPYRIDVGAHLRSGKNSLIIKVTNLWPNRLIGDEQFPEEHEYLDKIFEGQVGGFGIKSIPDWYIQGLPKPKTKRTTFSTWKHYQKDDPLLESGLVGPVHILNGMLMEHPAW